MVSPLGCRPPVCRPVVGKEKTALFQTIRSRPALSLPESARLMPTSLRFSGAFVIIPAIEGRGARCSQRLRESAWSGAAKQSGLREVVHELLALLEQRQVEVVLEDRLGELVDDSSHPRPAATRSASRSTW